MKLKLPFLPLILLFVFQSVFAGDSVKVIRDYIQITYGNKLKITSEQIEQLSWVVDNTIRTPEMDTKSTLGNIHREIPRALSRLYCLQLLRSGENADYERFIAPQTDIANPKLNRDSFAHLTRQIKALDGMSYEVLQATAIISAVTLSVTAKSKALSVFGKKLPEDSEQFLSITMTEAGKIYPLARQIIKKTASAARQFEIAYLPNSHLRHMLYNEGSLAMFSSLKKGIAEGRIKQQDMDLWYARWMVNIAGFRGHLAPDGSVYLTQHTYIAMNQMKVALDKMYKDAKVNPMTIYLQKRSNWLHLSNWTKNPEERQALASLTAMLRLYTPQDGKVLFHSFRELSKDDQQRWIRHAANQMKILDEPAATYGPAVFANSIILVGLAETIKKVLPVMLTTYEQGEKLRKAGLLKNNIPLSFRELASKSSVERILRSEKLLIVDINPENGLAALKK